MSLIGRISLLVVSASRHASKSLAETRRLKRGATGSPNAFGPPPVKNGKCLRAKKFPRLTRPSLQRWPGRVRVPAVGHDCARPTPGAALDTPASSRGGAQPRPSAHASGSRDSRDRSGAWPPANAAAVRTGRRRPNKSIGRDSADVAGTTDDTPRPAGIP